MQAARQLRRARFGIELTQLRDEGHEPRLPDLRNETVRLAWNARRHACSSTGRDKGVRASTPPSP